MSYVPVDVPNGVEGINASNQLVGRDASLLTNITFSGNPLASANILVGNGVGVAAPVLVSGGATLSNTGVLTLSNGAVTGQLLTGFTVVNAAAGSGDSILSAAGKFQGQINNTQKLISGATSNDFTYTTALGQTIDSGLSFSLDTTLGGGSSSNSLIPSQLAVKTYVDNNISGAFKIQGNWNASTNTPTLTAGIGTVGFAYIVNVAGTQTAPSGSPVSYEVGDLVYYGANNIWNDVPSGGVISVNGQQGIVVLALEDMSDVSATPTDAQILIYNSVATNWQAFNLSGGATMTNGGVVTLSNMAVTSQVLTGLAFVDSPVVATDTILAGIGKLQAQLNELDEPQLTVVSTNYQMVATDSIVQMSVGSITVTLPDATLVQAGQVYAVKLIWSASGSSTINTLNGQTIDGVSTYTMFPAYSLQVYSDLSNWNIL